MPHRISENCIPKAKESIKIQKNSLEMNKRVLNVDVISILFYGCWEFYRSDRVSNDEKREKNDTYSDSEIFFVNIMIMEGLENLTRTGHIEGKMKAERRGPPTLWVCVKGIRNGNARSVKGSKVAKDLKW